MVMDGKETIVIDNLSRSDGDGTRTYGIEVGGIDGSVDVDDGDEQYQWGR